MHAAGSLDLEELGAEAQFCDLGGGAQVEDGGYAEGFEGGEVGGVEGGRVGGAVEEGGGGGGGEGEGAEVVDVQVEEGWREGGGHGFLMGFEAMMLY